MAWTHGFHNSVNGDRTYNAAQMSSIFEGLITAGVYQGVGNKLAVQPNSGMTIQIATGRGWFNERWVNNDAPYLINLEASDVILNRYAAICVRGDNSTGSRTTQPYVKYSEFATTPVKPTMTRTTDVKEYCLAYVYIAAGATSISAANIEDTRQDSNLCGWVTGLIDQITPNTLYSQFTAQFNEWFSGLVDVIDENVETTLVNALPKSLTVNLSNSDWRTVNLLRNTNYTRVIEGVSYTVNDDGSVTVNGTASSGANSFFEVNSNIALTVGTQYIISGCPTGGADSTFRVDVRGVGEDVVYSSDYGTGRSFSATASSARVVIRVQAGATVNNLTFKPMLRLASVSDPTYVKYGLYAQQVSVLGMNSTKSVVVTSNSETLEAYSNSGVKATGQSTNTLTFTATTQPTVDIKVDILHMGQ